MQYCCKALFHIRQEELQHWLCFIVVCQIIVDFVPNCFSVQLTCKWNISLMSILASFFRASSCWSAALTPWLSKAAWGSMKATFFRFPLLTLSLRHLRALALSSVVARQPWSSSKAVTFLESDNKDTLSLREDVLT